MHESFANLATRLIAKNGRVFVLKRTSADDGDWDSVGVDEYTTVIGVQTEFTDEEGITVSKGLVEVHDIAVMVDSLVEIDSDMRLQEYPDNATLPPLGEWQGAAGLNGATLVSDYSIVDTGHIKPGTRSIMYMLHARL